MPARLASAFSLMSVARTLGPLAMEGLGEGPPDALARRRDDRALALQSIHFRLP